jgi:hypothetical protein
MVVLTHCACGFKALRMVVLTHGGFNTLRMVVLTHGGFNTLRMVVLTRCAWWF